MNNAKRMLTCIVLVLASGYAGADVQVHEYTSSVIDGKINKSTFETGTKIEREGNECLERTTSLVKWNQFSSGNQVFELPELTTRSVAINCPS